MNPNYTYNASGNLIPNAGASPGAPGSADPTPGATTNTGTPIAPTPPSTPLVDSFSVPPPSSVASAPSPGTPSVPKDNLAPGSQGQDVQQLQDYLVQMGYLSPQQVASGPGVYGPQTTAAVAAMQKQLGLNPGTAAGTYGPQTQQALASKYQNLFQSVQNKDLPSSAAAANMQLQSAAQTTTDPVFGAMLSQMQPIMDSLNQVLQNINNPALTSVSLQNEYNSLQQQYNLPQMQASLLNMQNIMTGTTDDIRQEITTSGGQATESQIQAMSSARNNVILKQYNALSTQYTAAQTNVQNMMQYASQDQSNQLQVQQASAGVVENMASIQTQMVGMAQTMQQNAVSAAQYNISQTGYQAFAKTLQGNPQMQSYYESLLNLAPGTLSNPQTLSALDTYKDQTQQLNDYKAALSAFSAGYSGAPPSGSGSGYTSSSNIIPSTGPNPGTISAQLPVSSLARPSFVSQNTPLSLSSSQMQQYLSAAPKNGNGSVVVGGSAGNNAAGNNITVQGVGNYVAQPDGSYYLSSAIPSTSNDTNTLISQLKEQNPPTLSYGDISAIMANSPGSQYPPSSTAFYREQRSARQIVGNYVNSPVYETVSNAPLPFARIKAAENGDNSVSDIELVDSYITLAKGQGQITEAQVSALDSASSVSDKLNIIKQKVVGAGALISSDQRQSLLNLSGSVFNQYASAYQQMYTQAINTLAKNHVEPALWGVVPDFSQLIGGATIDTSND